MSDKTVDRVISEKKFNSLLNRFQEGKKRVRSLSGDLGTEVKEAVERDNLHKGAFALFARLDGMDELKRNDFLRAFDIYRDRAEADKGRWNGTGDIVDRAQQQADKEAEEKASADAKQTETNVTRLRRGIRQKEEDAPTVGMPGAPAVHPTDAPPGTSLQ